MDHKDFFLTGEKNTMSWSIGDVVCFTFRDKAIRAVVFDGVRATDGKKVYDVSRYSPVQRCEATGDDYEALLRFCSGPVFRRYLPAVLARLRGRHPIQPYQRRLAAEQEARQRYQMAREQQRTRQARAHEKKTAALQQKRVSLETRLCALLETLPHATDEEGVRWWCLPISPEPAVEPLRCFLDLLRATLSLFLTKHQQKKGWVEYEETMRSTILVLELALGERPDLSYFGWFGGSSVFRSISLRRPIAQTVQKRRGCRGHLLLAARNGRCLMSMTAWERVMTAVEDGKTVTVQEHALIVKNPLLAPSQNIRGLAMRMHSFAADTLRREIVVCSPYLAMARILEDHLENETIDRAGYLEDRLDDPCVAFGAAYRIVNNEKLRSVWRR